MSKSPGMPSKEINLCIALILMLPQVILDFRL
jgi:hypothetical protein